MRSVSIFWGRLGLGWARLAWLADALLAGDETRASF